MAGLVGLIPAAFVIAFAAAWFRPVKPLMLAGVAAGIAAVAGVLLIALDPRPDAARVVVVIIAALFAAAGAWPGATLAGWFRDGEAG